MIDNAVIQADLVTDLLADAVLTALLDTEGEVREDQYQGTVFGYPAIRVKVDGQTPIAEREQCDHTRLTFTIVCLTESGSSKTCDELAGAVKDRLHKRYFVGTDWYSWFRCVGLRSADRLPQKLWRAQVMISGVVYPTAPQLGWHAP